MRLSVYSTTYLSTGTASVDIKVESSEVVATISGGAEQSVPPGDSVQLTAVDSRDLDFDYDSASDTERDNALRAMTFTWYCLPTATLKTPPQGLSLAYGLLSAIPLGLDLAVPKYPFAASTLERPSWQQRAQQRLI